MKNNFENTTDVIEKYNVALDAFEKTFEKH